MIHCVSRFVISCPVFHTSFMYVTECYTLPMLHSG